MTDERGPPVLHLDDVEHVRQAEGMDWLPVRRSLGISAFGVNAYVAHAAGDELVPAHDEAGPSAARHEELYVVVAGHAEFELDGTPHDAPAGTLVYVRDPAVRRSARALAAGTTVLAVGARPGEAFAVSPWEDNAIANDRSRRGDHEGAIRLAREVLGRRPDDPTVLYNLACYHALAGEPDEALAYLSQAAGIAPDRVAAWADGDSDLDAIRGLPGFPLGAAAR